MTRALGLRILVLSGPTREPLDPVRYISNASTGRQGREIARAAIERGHTVDLVEGPVPGSAPAGVRLWPVTTAREMLERAVELHPACDVLVGAAAVADWRPVVVPERKRKRGGDPGERWLIELVPNPDILATLGEGKGDRVHIGFALETDELEANARRKLEAKRLDWVVANSPEAIGAEAASYRLLGPDGAVVDLGPRSKRELALRLVGLAEAGAPAADGPRRG